jgi:hypothetical protein
MTPPEREPRPPDPRLILLGAVTALLAGIAAIVVVVLLAQQVIT